MFASRESAARLRGAYIQNLPWPRRRGSTGHQTGSAIEALRCLHQFLARAKEFRRAALKLGFKLDRTKGSHEFWAHEDGRVATIPVHGSREIGGSLFRRIVDQLGITIEEFRRLK